MTAANGAFGLAAVLRALPALAATGTAGLAGVSAVFLTAGLAALLTTGIAVLPAGECTGKAAAGVGVRVFLSGMFTLSLLWEASRGEPRSTSSPNRFLAVRPYLVPDFLVCLLPTSPAEKVT